MAFYLGIYDLESYTRIKKLIKNEKPVKSSTVSPLIGHLWESR